MCCSDTWFVAVNVLLGEWCLVLIVKLGSLSFCPWTLNECFFATRQMVSVTRPCELQCTWAYGLQMLSLKYPRQRSQLVHMQTTASNLFDIDAKMSCCWRCINSSCPRWHDGGDILSSCIFCCEFFVPFHYSHVTSHNHQSIFIRNSTNPRSAWYNHSIC